MRILRQLVVCFFAVLVTLPAVSSGAGAQGLENRLRNVRVEGAQRVEADTVRSYMGMRTGDSISSAVLDKALKALFATGLFADVNIRQDGQDVVVRIVENPIINRLAFEGNKRITSETLSDEVKLRPRVVFTRARVQTDLQRIMDLYRRSGRFSATVVPKVIQLPQNRVDLVFEISEGELTEIRKIAFVGNRHFDDGDLREVVQTKESAWYRFLSSDDTYDPDRLTFDRELLRRHYLANGYADFRVVSAVAELTPDSKAFFVTFTVDEGPRYKFGKVEITTALRDLDVSKLNEEQTIVSGDWYNADEVESMIGKLTDAVGVFGYAFVDIRPRVRRDRKTRLIDVTFVIQEGPRVFVETVKISGNVRTLDKVIRREILLVEGDAFNTSKLRRSRQRIRNLGFFERVEIENKAGSSADKTVIDVSLKEKSTGEISFGAGFSSAAGVVGDARAAISERVRMPSGYRITEPLTQLWKYTLRQDKITDIPSDASLAIKEQEGDFITSSIGQTLRYDKRDNRFNPTDGYYVELENTLAGFGGDSKYLRNEIRGGTFYEIYDKWILSFGVGTGYIIGIGDDIRIIDRFFLGGDTLRGFEDSGVGPRDLATQDAIGGNFFYRTTVGVTFPLGLPNEFGLRGRLFTDAGSLSENDSRFSTLTDTGSVRMSIGTGILWDSPFGPVNLDLAQALVKEDFDKTELFRFSFGAKF